ncbi:hypothetical protein QKC54_gp0660 [Megavirus baoshan]|uniref:Uncharacterized protein n=1 Tax=Megavirus baoshan TaxID=2496520 RepID=A0A3Q8U7S1_9VIRU|nr:hypothetical protein QKC54_gp0660 [Megavirus baoshan]AZL89177.1 hypothetical protein Mb0412 [Megavirus baoshan]
METIKIIFTDTMYIFLTCINSIISFIFDNSKHLFKKPELNSIIRPKIMNSNLSDNSSDNLSDNSSDNSSDNLSNIERQNIANIRLAKFNQPTGINRIIQEKNKKKSLFESKFLEMQKDRHNQQLIRDWMN